MIYLVTDSTSCLSREDIKELQIIMVPMSYTGKNNTPINEGYVEECEICKQTGILNLEGYSTSQASVNAFSRVFKTLIAHGHQALCLTLSSRLSGTYRNACQAALETGGGQVEVVDSRTTAGSLYLLLRQARSFLTLGCDLKQATARLKTLISKTHTLFSVQNMDPLRRSGRLGIVRLSVSTLLNLRPVLSLIDGAVVSQALARGGQHQLRYLEDSIKGSPQMIVVQHCGCEASAIELRQRLLKRGHKVLIRPLNMVLAIHVGVPCLSVAWMEQTA